MKTFWGRRDKIIEKWRNSYTEELHIGTVRTIKSRR
jgi:hypothetical protein